MFHALYIVGDDDVRGGSAIEVLGFVGGVVDDEHAVGDIEGGERLEIGRASCRERVYDSV